MIFLAFSSLTVKVCKVASNTASAWKHYWLLSLFTSLTFFILYCNIGVQQTALELEHVHQTQIFFPIRMLPCPDTLIPNFQNFSAHTYKILKHISWEQFSSIFIDAFAFCRSITWMEFWKHASRVVILFQAKWRIFFLFCFIFITQLRITSSVSAVVANRSFFTNRVGYSIKVGRQVDGLHYDLGSFTWGWQLNTSLFKHLTPCLLSVTCTTNWFAE